MQRNLFNSLAIAGCALLLSACRIEIVVPEGGELRDTLIGESLVCDAEEACTIEITAANFIAVYTAVPHAGWEFAGWQQDQGFICGPGRGTFAFAPESCGIDNTGYSGIALLEAVIAGDDFVTYISPLFVPLTAGTPITDTISVAGKEWAQPADFTGLSWDGINALCPGGMCGPGVILRGFDMDGWTWATLEDINGLANHYLAGEYTMGPGPDSVDSAVVMNVIVDASGIFPTPPAFGGPWRTTPDTNPSPGATVIGFLGLSSTESSTNNALGTTGHFFWGASPGGFFSGRISTTGARNKSDNDLKTGAFFYRLP